VLSELERILSKQDGLRERFGREFIDYRTGDDFVTGMLMGLGPKNNVTASTGRFIRYFKNSRRLRPIKDPTEFVRDFILDEEPIKIAHLRDSYRLYSNISAQIAGLQIAGLKTQAQDLRSCLHALKAYAKAALAARRYRLLELRAELGGAVQMLFGAKRRLAENRKREKRAREDLAFSKRQLAERNEILRQKEIQLNTSDISVRILQKIDYTSFGHDAEAMRASLERLRAAKEAGAVELELGRGVHRETIVRVRLLDDQKLAAFLGKDTAAAVAQKGQLALAALFDVCPDWVRAIGDEVLDKWRRRREACSLKPGDIEGLRELLMLLAAFDRGRHRGLDIRTFSMKAGCHSKAFKAHAAAIGTILKARLPDDIKAQDLSSEEVLDYLGLQKFQQPILVSGPLRWGNVVTCASGSVSPSAGPATCSARRVRANAMCRCCPTMRTR